KYTPSGGIPKLKQAIVKKFKEDNTLQYSTQQIIVTTGAKHALYTLFQVILYEKDEVIVSAPYWVSYTEQVKLAGAKHVIRQTQEENNLKLTAKQFEARITKNAKGVIINSLSHPTAMMYNKEELTALGKVCLKHDIFIVSDEIYEKLI